MTFPGIFPSTFFQTGTVAVTGIIQSIQNFEIIIASGATSNTATIATVDNTRTAIFAGDYAVDSANSDAQNVTARVELTNPTTITALRNGNIGNITLQGVAVEFNSTGVDSVQYGTCAFVSANLTATATVGSAAANRTSVLFLGHAVTSGSTVSPQQFATTVELTNPTTITASRDAGLTTAYGETGWALITFASGVASVQHQLFTSTSAGLSEQHAIPTQVNPSRTIIGWGGNRGNTSVEGALYCHLSLAASAAVTVARDESSSAARSVAYNLIEFAAVHVNSTQRGAITILSSALSNTATITSANASKSLLTYCGVSTGGDNPPEKQTSVKFTDPTTVTASKGIVSTLASDSCTASWEVITFV